MTNKIYIKIQKEINEKLPAGLDKILKSSGFDTLVSISAINETGIKDIENYVSNNPAVLIGTEYEPSADQLQNNYQFKLKPGHKHFILNLPKSIEKLRLKEDEKQNKRIASRQIQDRITIVGIDEHKLKEKLVHKVLNFTRSKSFEILFDLSHISQLQKKR